MNGELTVAEKFEHDHLNQVAGQVRADEEHLRWIGVGFDVDDDKRELLSVANVVVREPVSLGRTMDLHTPLL